MNEQRSITNNTAVSEKPVLPEWNIERLFRASRRSTRLILP
ncbi:MAG: hypothetical protein ACLR56_15065 [Oscillospiraceae bacterium]